LDNTLTKRYWNICLKGGGVLSILFAHPSEKKENQKNKTIKFLTYPGKKGTKSLIPLL